MGSYSKINKAQISCYILLTMVMLGGYACKSDDAPGTMPKVLVFFKTEGFRHASISDGQNLFDSLADVNNWSISLSDQAVLFHPDSLRKFNLIIFLNTTGDILDSVQQVAMENWYRSGGRFMGIHSATDTEYQWPFYNQMVGAYFDGHPPQQEATLISGAAHPSNVHLPERWTIFDEWYNFRDLSASKTDLLFVDESSYTGGTMGANHPMAWTLAIDNGRTWYTGIGHAPDTYRNKDYVQMIEAAALDLLNN